LVNETNTEVAEPMDYRDDKYYFYELSNYDLDSVSKGFAHSY